MFLQTFQRIRNNRQNRLRIKVRKRKYGEMYFMENMFCNSCPICTKRRYAMETGKMPPDDDLTNKVQEEIETVDVESCNDDVPDSGSELHQQQQQSHQQQQQIHHAHMPALSGSSSHSSSHSSSNSVGGGNGGSSNSTLGANLHNSNSQPGKLDGILYRTACVMNKESNSSSGGIGMMATGEDDISTNVATTSTNSNSSSGSTTNWTEAHTSTNTTGLGHISGGLG